MARSTKVVDSADALRELIPTGETPGNLDVNTEEWIRKQKTIAHFSLDIAGPYLITNHFCDDAIAEIVNKPLEEEAAAKTLSKRPKKPRLAPEVLADNSRYLDPEGSDCIPSLWFKMAVLTVLHKDRGLKWVADDMQKHIYTHGPKYPDLCPLTFQSKDMRRDVCKVGDFNNRKPCPRYRMAYTNWGTVVFVELNVDKMTPKQFFELLVDAEDSGVGDWRPGQSKSGWAGRFKVVGISPIVITGPAKEKPSNGKSIQATTLAAAL
jgi:hypothetical protein